VGPQARLAETDCAAIWDVSLFNVFRYADDEDIGQAFRRSEAFDLDVGVEAVDKGRRVADGDRQAFAVAAFGADFDDATWHNELEARLRLMHRHHTGLKQHRGNADRVGPGHRIARRHVHHRQPARPEVPRLDTGCRRRCGRNWDLHLYQP
jgi:hypothetical protein